MSILSEFVTDHPWIMSADTSANIIYRDDKFVTYKKTGWFKKSWVFSAGPLVNDHLLAGDLVCSAVKPVNFKPETNKPYTLHYFSGTAKYELMTGQGIAASNLTTCIHMHEPGVDFKTEFATLIELLVGQPDIDAIVWKTPYSVVRWESSNA